MLREVSAERFCPEALKEEIRASDSNQGSLVRVFAEGKEGPSLWFFSLRNTPLWLGRAERLGFGVEGWWRRRWLRCIGRSKLTQIVEFLFPGGKPNGSRRTDTVPAGALEKKCQGLIHEIGGYGEEWDG
jgi:hypothetical protein